MEPWWNSAWGFFSLNPEWQEDNPNHKAWRQNKDLPKIIPNTLVCFNNTWQKTHTENQKNTKILEQTRVKQHWQKPHSCSPIFNTSGVGAEIPQNPEKVFHAVKSTTISPRLSCVYIWLLSGKTNQAWVFVQQIFNPGSEGKNLWHLMLGNKL